MELAIIGLGGWGRQHLKCLLENSQIKPAYLVDKNPEALKSIREEFGIDAARCFTSFNRMIRDVNIHAAIVCVPNPERIPIIIRLLNRNVHCLLEKPLAHSLGDLLRLKKVKQRSKSVLMISQNYRFLRIAQYIKKQLAPEILGAVRHISLYFCRRESFLSQGFYSRLGGAKVIALELGSHHIDLLNYFIGAFPLTVWGSTWHEKDDEIKADCHLSAQFLYPRNILVNYTSTLMGGANRTEWTGRFEIDCENGHILWDETEKKPLRIFIRKEKSRAIEKHIPSFPPYPGNSLSHAHKAFFNAVSGKISPAASACLFESNAMCVITGIAIYESGLKKRPVDFPHFVKKRFDAYADI